jgi:hypothetical protein
MSESLVLCEGFHDRAFWAGWLGHLGCSDDGFRPNTPGYPAVDPFGEKVRGGQYAYRTRGGGFVRVVPCGGRGNILPAARTRLRQRATKALVRLVVNIDPDVDIGAEGASSAGLRAQNIREVVTREFDPAAGMTSEGDIAIDGGTTLVSLIRWEADDPHAEGVPAQQTLERLACTAIVAAYRDRARAVHGWLGSRPAAPVAGPKEHAWSYMAGWYAEHGCDDFYAHLWRDPQIVPELRGRLERSGAWRIAEALAR